MNLIDSLQWRYATKQFDASKKISAADLQTLQDAVSLAPTSYGLQPFRVLLITDPELREKLKAAAYGQPQITDASHLFVFAHKLDITEAYIDDFMQRTAQARGIETESLAGYSQVIKGSVAGKSPEAIAAWNQRQAYIALGHLLVAAATHHIDACPMEGFDPASVDKILGLAEQGLATAVIAAVGYRSAEDKMQLAAKVRLPQSELFVNI